MASAGSSSTQNIIDILKPGSNNFQDTINNIDIKNLIYNLLGDILRKGIRNLSEAMRNTSFSDDKLSDLVFLLAKGYINNRLDNNELDQLNVLLGKIGCIRTTRGRGRICIVDSRGVRRLIAISNGMTFEQYIEFIENMDENTRDVRVKLLKNIIKVIKPNINNEFKRAIEKLASNCNHSALITYIYLSVINDYSLFDDLEWILVLASRAFSNSNAGYLPICPTLGHAIRAYYEFRQRCWNNSITTVNIKGLIEYLLKQIT